MSDESREVQRLISELSKHHVKTKFIDATVVSVDEKNRTCTVDSEDNNIDGLVVRLIPSIADGEISFPSVDSSVTVAYSQFTKAHIVGATDIDKKRIVIEKSGLELTKDLLKFNDGGYGGLIIIKELVDRMNNIEDAYNDLVQKYNAHIHTTTATVGTGPVGVIAPTTSLETTTLIKTKKDDIENPNITHGKSL